MGGYDGTHYLACAERLDPRTDRYAMCRCASPPARAFVCDTLHLFPSARPRLLTLAVACVHGAARRWEVLSCSMASKRGGHAVAAAGGALYAMGGFDGVQALRQCEAFDTRVRALVHAPGCVWWDHKP